MKANKTDARIAAVHFEAIQAHSQALHSLDIGESNIRSVITARNVYLSIAEDVRKRAGIKDEQPAIFRPAFPNAMQRHI